MLRPARAAPQPAIQCVLGDLAPPGDLAPYENLPWCEGGFSVDAHRAACAASAALSDTEFMRLCRLLCETKGEEAACGMAIALLDAAFKAVQVPSSVVPTPFAQLEPRQQMALRSIAEAKHGWLLIDLRHHLRTLALPCRRRLLRQYVGLPPDRWMPDVSQIPGITPEEVARMRAHLGRSS